MSNNKKQTINEDVGGALATRINNFVNDNKKATANELLKYLLKRVEDVNDYEISSLPEGTGTTTYVNLALSKLNEKAKTLLGGDGGAKSFINSYIRGLIDTGKATLNGKSLKSRASVVNEEAKPNYFNY